ncbi:unnamed protein product [Gadus morhua 'NCC']
MRWSRPGFQGRRRAVQQEDSSRISRRAPGRRPRSLCTARDGEINITLPLPSLAARLYMKPFDPSPSQAIRAVPLEEDRGPGPPAPLQRGPSSCPNQK